MIIFYLLILNHDFVVVNNVFNSQFALGSHWSFKNRTYYKFYCVGLSEILIFFDNYNNSPKIQI